MASISSLMSSGSSGSIYGSRNSNIISGLASGMDTEAMIEGMVMGYKQKIIGLQQDRTMLSWQQERYQSISDQLVEFSRKYTSYNSPTNLLSASFFNNSVITSTTGKYKDLVSATGKSNSSVTLDSVAQLATSSRYNNSASSLDTDPAVGGVVDMSDPILNNKLHGNLNLTYGNQKFSINFGKLEDYTKSKNDKTLDPKKLEEGIKEKLSEIQLKDADGNKVNASTLIDVKVADDGTVSFTDKSSSGNSVYINSADGNLKNMITDYDSAVEDKSSSFKIDMVEDVGEETMKKGEALSHQSFSVTFNGQTKTITLGEIKPPEGEEWSDSEWNKQVHEALQKEIDKAFGTNKVEVKWSLDPESASTKGMFSFHVKDGNTFSIKTSSTAIGEILFGEGNRELTTYLNVNKTLGDLGEFKVDPSDPSKGILNLGGVPVEGKVMDPIPEEDRIEKDDGTFTDKDGNKLDEEGYRINDDGERLYEFSLELNGKEVGKFTQDTELTTIIGKINSDPDVGFDVVFSDLTNEFVFTAEETGSGRTLELGDGLAKALFGTDQKEELGKDAIFRATVNGKSGTYVRNSNSFEVDGLTISFSGTFNVAEGAEIPEDTSDPSKIPDAIFDLNGEKVSFNTKTDTEKIVKAVKEMVEDYNKMIEEVKKSFSEMPLKKADGSKGGARYKPLTDEDKEGMTESEIKAYEEKAKTGILFMDRDLSNLYNDLRSAISPAGPDGSYLRSIGIETNYEDGLTTIKFDETKFEQALEKDLDGVRDVFTKSKEYGAENDGLIASIKTVTDRYAATTGATKGILIEKAGSKYAPTAAMDNDMLDKMNEIDKQIASWQEKMGDKVDYYTHKFTQLEMLINQMNSQGAALAGMASGGGM